MSDHELNLAIHQEVEGWVGHVNPNRDYCNDPAWCVWKIEEHKLGVLWRWDKWWVQRRDGDKLVSKPYDFSLTRAVALAVLRLHREGKRL